MTKENQEKVATQAKEATNETTKPVIKRRGISNETKAVTQLHFHEKDASTNGLFIGHLADISVGWSTNTDAKIFTGMRVPHIVIHFASNHTNVNEQRHVYQTLYPVESNVNTIPGGKDEWKVNNIMAWIKHMLDIFYLRGRALTPEEEESLSLAFVDYDENNDYVVVEPQDVIDSYGNIFQAACDMLNGVYGIKDGETPKPCFKTADGKILPLWMKLLRHKKVKQEWVNVVRNGDLGFDTFIGSGVVEIMRKDMPPAILRIDFSKESITPKETKKTPTIGAPGMPVGGIVPGAMPVAPMESGFNEAYNAASGDMPF